MTRSVNRVLQSTSPETEREGLREPGYCRILVLGIGGAGNNTVSRLMEMGVTGAECVAVNTDRQHLNATRATHKVLIGEKTTRGLGAGGNLEVGKAAIEESRKKLEEILTDVDVVFITAGLGGGTGTSAAPVVAKIARRNGAIVVGVVTTPFRTEKGRIECGVRGLYEMRRECHTVMAIDNNKLMQLAPQLPLNETFKVADQVLANMIKGVVETISTPSLVNLDFADFRTIVTKGGVAVVGVGESDAPNRAEEAVRNALRSPLLEVDYGRATGALIHVCGGNQMTIEEANRVGEFVRKMMDNHASVIWGARVNPSLEDVLRVTLVMTGVQSPQVLSVFGTIAPQLFDIDPCAEPEEQLPIDLGLDQIEDFE